MRRPWAGFVHNGFVHNGTLKSKNEPNDHTRVSNVPAALSNTRVPRTHASVGGAFSPGVSFLSGGKKGAGWGQEQIMLQTPKAKSGKNISNGWRH